MPPDISLEQWRSLIAVVENGGYARAAAQLFKSQSAVTYAVQKIESLLNVKLFTMQGRRAMLTPTGQMLYRRAVALLAEANDLETAAHTLSAGWEAVIHLAVEILFPTPVLLECLGRFSQTSPRTRIELVESVLGGTTDALLHGEADLAISPQLPAGHPGNLLMHVRVVAVAHADHPLHHLGHALTLRELRTYRHIVVRDSGSNRDERQITTVDVDQRWTVSNLSTSIEAVVMKQGFAWLPEAHIHTRLQSGELRPLPLREGGIREIPLYLVLAHPDVAGPGTRHLAETIRTTVSDLSEQRATRQCPDGNVR